MIERWLPVIGFEGLYEVSDQGRVRSLSGLRPWQRRDRYTGAVTLIQRWHEGRVLRPGRKPSGHVSVAIAGRSHDVHVLVLMAFVGPCPAGMEALHFDDVGSNNALANLRWGTRGDNLRDAMRNGRKSTGELVPWSKLRRADISIIRSRIKQESVAALARHFGVNESTIRQVRDRLSWKDVA